MACSFSLCSPHLSSSKLSSRYSPSSSLPSPSTNPNNGNTAFSSPFNKPCLLLPPSLPRLASSSSSSFPAAAIRQCRTTTRTMSLPVMASSSSQGSVETSYVMIKPDGVQRGLIGEIISRFERKGFLIKGLKLFSCPKELAEEHYKDLSSKPFFPGLVQYITSGPVVCMALEGPPGLVASARKLIGVTNPLLAEPGTIRGDLGIEVGRNVVHGSDSPENGEREIALWFKEGELCEWEQTIFPWLRE